MAAQREGDHNPDRPAGKRPRRRLSAAGEIAERLEMTLEAAPDTLLGGEGVALRRIDPGSQGVRGFIPGRRAGGRAARRRNDGRR